MMRKQRAQLGLFTLREEQSRVCERDRYEELKMKTLSFRISRSTESNATVNSVRNKA